MKDAEGRALKTTLQAADIVKLMELLPHRYPFLLIDKIIEIDGDRSAIGIKNVSINESFFQGHFPKFPIMPGVLQIEGMAQTAGAICINRFIDQYDSQIVYFMSIDRAKFRHPVVPGDQIRYHVKLIRNRGKIWRFQAEGRVDGKLVSEAIIGAMVDNDVKI